MVIIVVVGMPGSGKDIFARTAESRGFAHVRMGDVVREFVRKAGLPMDDGSVGGFANRERHLHGDDVWAARTLERMPTGNLIIDGSRSLAEIKHFRTVFGEVLVVVGIRAPDEQRFLRLSGRKREDDPKTRKEFDIRDRREVSWGILEALEKADLVLDNEEGLEEFRQACTDALESITKHAQEKY